LRRGNRMNFGLSEITCATIRRILERYSNVEKAVLYGTRLPTI
jgi:hypothetical protein